MCLGIAEISPPLLVSSSAILNENSFSKTGCQELLPFGLFMGGGECQKRHNAQQHSKGGLAAATVLMQHKHGLRFPLPEKLLHYARRFVCKNGWEGGGRYVARQWHICGRGKVLDSFVTRGFLKSDKPHPGLSRVDPTPRGATEINFGLHQKIFGTLHQNF